MGLEFFYHVVVGRVDVESWRNLTVPFLGKGWACTANVDLDPDRSVIKWCSSDGIRCVASISSVMKVCRKRCM